MPELNVVFEIYCDTCGSDLYKNVRIYDTDIRVEVCQDCLDKEKEKIEELEEKIRVLEKDIEKLQISSV